jgi:hypothetical protein
MTRRSKSFYSGFKVRQTKPRQDDDAEDFVPEFFVSWSGMLMARYPDGSFAPIKTDKNGYVYVERYDNE